MGENTKIQWAKIAERFWSKVDRGGNDDCWPWLGAKLESGYGVFYLNALGVRNTTAHRAAYILTHGSIVRELMPDHLCRNRSCCNPFHLEAVTNQENAQRGLKGRLVTVCKNGHPYTPENTKIRADGRRACRACRKKWDSGAHKGRDAAYWREYRRRRAARG